MSSATACSNGGSPLVDRLAAAIQGQILGGSIPVGSRLRQEALAGEFEVSRTPVREALRKLQATGIVELLPNRGAIVRGPSARDIQGLRGAGRARRARGGARSGPDQRPRPGRLREAEELFRRSVTSLVERRRRAEANWGDASSWVQANDLFHQAIQDAAANRRLAATIADLHQLSARPHLGGARGEARTCSRRTSASTRGSSPRSSSATAPRPDAAWWSTFSARASSSHATSNALHARPPGDGEGHRHARLDRHAQARSGSSPPESRAWAARHRRRQLVAGRLHDRGHAADLDAGGIRDRPRLRPSDLDRVLQCRGRARRSATESEGPRPRSPPQRPRRPPQRRPSPRRAPPRRCSGPDIRSPFVALSRCGHR